ncbi:hypothetical protein [Labilibacter marinus]|uniref:hypothetical protein n=1 Tax=Labilibacter marinus TaxID=1477105 RepID=UPI000833C56B|nr:hypothetical protein [Labilibacter marinus]
MRFKIVHKLIFVLSGLLVLTSCQPKSKLEGIWIGAYKIDHTESDSVIMTNRYLLDIEKEELTVKVFDYPMSGRIGLTERFKYILTKDSLKTVSDTFLIKSLNTDSLVLNHTINNKRDLVFKRLLQDKTSPNVELTNKAFVIKYPHYTDSIDFINDSLFMEIDRSFRTTRWSISNYKGFKFLIIDKIAYPLYLIHSCSEHEVNLKRFANVVMDYKMTEIECKMDTCGLIGKWICPINDSIPLPPVPLWGLLDADPKESLIIEKDSIKISQFGRTEVKKWELNSTNELIYFPECNSRESKVWRIVQLSKIKLKLERNSKTHIKTDNEVIEFIRNE